MQVISTTELSRLTRAQLFSLLTQIQAVIADLPQGSPEYQFAMDTLNSIKIVLFQKKLAP